MAATGSMVNVSRNAKKLIISPEARKNIEDNPGRYTKEGVQYYLWLWTASRNKYVRMKYKLMLEQCQKLKESKIVTVLEKDDEGKDKEVKKYVLSYDVDSEPQKMVTKEVFEAAKKMAQRYEKIRDSKKLRVRK